MLRGSTRRQLLLMATAGAGGLLAGWIASSGSRPEDISGGDAGRSYHQRSKSGYGGSPLSALLGLASRVGGESRPEEIPLPDDFSDRGLTVEEAIEQRRSVRAYSSASLSLLQVARLLHRATGITDLPSGYRAAPSAGALYPVELYVVANRVESLPSGIYRYRCRGHSLISIRHGDYGGSLALAALGQDMVARAPLVLVLAAVFERSRQKYGERSYRYVLMECGHVAQNVYLAAVSMGVGACVVGAFLDDELNGLLGLDGTEEAALYLITVGPR